MLCPSHHVTLAIAGGDSLVGHALELMLRSAGYEARFLDTSSINGPSNPLEGASLLLLAPRTSKAKREALLGHLRKDKSDKRIALPMLELVGNGEAEDGEEVGARRVLWPCQLKNLKQEIENALLNESSQCNSREPRGY